MHPTTACGTPAAIAGWRWLALTARSAWNLRWAARRSWRANGPSRCGGTASRRPPSRTWTETCRVSRPRRRLPGTADRRWPADCASNGTSCLARQERFLLLADAVLGERSGALDYRGTLPLAPGVSWRGAKETREGILVGRRRALVLPLALPEWRRRRRRRLRLVGHVANLPERQQVEQPAAHVTDVGHLAMAAGHVAADHIRPRAVRAVVLRSRRPPHEPPGHLATTHGVPGSEGPAGRRGRRAIAWRSAAGSG